MESIAANNNRVNALSKDDKNQEKDLFYSITWIGYVKIITLVIPYRQKRPLEI